MPIKTVTAAAIAFMLGAAVAVQAAATLTVSQRGLMLSKSSATIAKGDSIVFTNEDDVIHNIHIFGPATSRKTSACRNRARRFPMCSTRPAATGSAAIFIPQSRCR